MDGEDFRDGLELAQVPLQRGSVAGFQDGDDLALFGGDRVDFEIRKSPQAGGGFTSAAAACEQDQAGVVQGSPPLPVGA